MPSRRRARRSRKWKSCQCPGASRQTSGHRRAPFPFRTGWWCPGLCNLLENAVRACAPGGEVRLEVASDQQAGVVFRVLDRGPGLTRKNARRRYADSGVAAEPARAAGLGSRSWMPLPSGTVAPYGCLPVQAAACAPSSCSPREASRRLHPIAGQDLHRRSTGMRAAAATPERRSISRCGFFDRQPAGLLCLPTSWNIANV